MKEQAPGVLQKLNEEGNTEVAGQAGFNDFEKIIKEGGLGNFPDFVRLNAKIGGVFSIMQANKGMETAKNLEESGQSMFSDGMRVIQEQLDDPNVPEETKVELRTALEELKGGAKELKDTYTGNLEWANLVMEQANKLSGLIVNKKDIEVIKKHEAEIFEAYTGFPEPVGNDGKLPPIKWE